MGEREVLLEVKGLKKYFPIKGGIFGKKTVNHVRAVEDVSFNVYKGETLGIVGESGCGKSTTGRTILRLIDPTEGSVTFEGVDLASLSASDMRKKRKDLQIVFQDPFASLNPRFKVGKAIEEPLKIFGTYSDSQRKEKVKDLMKQVGLKPEHIDRYPHQFSGGQRQRIGMARALSVQPKLIILDEPVSALDVSVQSQVLNLMQQLQEEYSLTYLFISHDLSVVKHLCDRVAVMYLGHMVELADKRHLYNEPLHPYTKALLSAVPTPNLKPKRERIILQGSVPSPSNPPSGCVFHTRCHECMDICKTEKPEMREVREGRYVACHLYNEEERTV
ncbi:dipeptide ABC transporter ATP-binding protein [Alkalihalophilus marmarensis]|jgi:peptide/nickel transport system ATP-binding protein/oligopeptide transport system ATP-binding protein|uniref:ABC transporter ATP-binding protein n=1 Tax=Alkalihalophilus marmarensis TaxID=521377 RepID=UPI002042070A|nr:dipeptide ABC transporter ATP-binding protein [Alkalihalophilus marmarensis]MCM3489821.1 dipeptide ABC transporter ATP-binding protein [Alkalihalophilus marmarensis]